MRANKSPGFLESEAHELMLINCNLMIFNEIDINWKLFELALILIALYFDPRITHTKVGRTSKYNVLTLILPVERGNKPIIKMKINRG